MSLVLRCFDAGPERVVSVGWDADRAVFVAAARHTCGVCDEWLDGFYDGDDGDDGQHEGVSPCGDDPFRPTWETEAASVLDLGAAVLAECGAAIPQATARWLIGSQRHAVAVNGFARLLADVIGDGGR